MTSSLLRVEPKSLHFHISNNSNNSNSSLSNALVNKLELINISEETIAYKIKCTDVKKFRLNKPKGGLKRGTKDVIIIELLLPFDGGRCNEAFSVVYGLQSSSTLKDEIRIPCSITFDNPESSDGLIASTTRHRSSSSLGGDQHNSNNTSMTSFPKSTPENTSKSRFYSSTPSLVEDIWMQTFSENINPNDQSISNKINQLSSSSTCWTWQGKFLFSLLFLLSTFVLLLPSPGVVLIDKEISSSSSSSSSVTTSEEYSLQYCLDNYWPTSLRPTCVVRCLASFLLGCLVAIWFKS